MTDKSLRNIFLPNISFKSEIHLVEEKSAESKKCPRTNIKSACNIASLYPFTKIACYYSIQNKSAQ